MLCQYKILKEQTWQTFVPREGESERESYEADMQREPQHYLKSKPNTYDAYCVVKISIFRYLNAQQP